MIIQLYLMCSFNFLTLRFTILSKYFHKWKSDEFMDHLNFLYEAFNKSTKAWVRSTLRYDPFLIPNIKVMAVILIFTTHLKFPHKHYYLGRISENEFKEVSIQYQVNYQYVLIIICEYCNVFDFIIHLQRILIKKKCVM